MPRGSGRRPKPSNLKKLQGNPGKRPLNDKEPIAPVGDPEMPADLPKIAEAEWKRIVPELRSLGVLSKIDRAALEGYCRAYARWMEAEAHIAKFGIIFREPAMAGGVPLLFAGEVVIAREKKSPAVTISEGAMKLMKSFLIEFGMTPASRSRLVTKAEEQAIRDPGDEYMAKVDDERAKKHVN